MVEARTALVVMTMNVNLSPQLEAMVKAKVASGLYTSASEVVREALRLMEQQDQLRSLQLQQLRSDIQEGLASGSPVPWSPDEIKQDGRRSKPPLRAPGWLTRGGDCSPAQGQGRSL
jgi:antitoxin ParD1/3/4